MSMSDDDFVALAGSPAGGAFRWDGDLVFVPLAPPGRAATERWGVLVPLPSSGAPQPWLYRRPVDAADAAAMLEIFTDEEVLTGAVGWAEQVRERGVRRFVLAPYGFRRADVAPV